MYRIYEKFKSRLASDTFGETYLADEDYIRERLETILNVSEFGQVELRIDMVRKGSLEVKEDANSE